MAIEKRPMIGRHRAAAPAAALQRKTLPPVFAPAPTGDAKIDLILKELVDVKNRLAHLEEHVSFTAANSVDRVIEAVSTM